MLSIVYTLFDGGSNVTVIVPFAPSVAVAFVPFVPNSLFKSSAVTSPVPLFSATAPEYAKLIASFSSAIPVCSFASFALVNIPFSPVKVAIDTPAKIKSTIIVLIFRYDYFFNLANIL